MWPKIGQQVKPEVGLIRVGPQDEFVVHRNGQKADISCGKFITNLFNLFKFRPADRGKREGIENEKIGLLPQPSRLDEFPVLIM